MHVFVDAFRALGSTVETISLEAWNDPGRRFEAAWKAKSFAPDVVFAIPNAGYGLHFVDDPEKDCPESLFTDILSIPLVLPWDHLLTQAPIYFLRDCLTSTPQQKGALAKIRFRLNGDRSHHYVFDSGHVQAYNELGLLDSSYVSQVFDFAHEHFIDQGEKNVSPSIVDRVGFTGNIYTTKTLASDTELLTSRIKNAVIGAKRRSWTVSGWELFQGELDSMPVEKRELAGLTPDHLFFWRVAYELLGSELLTEFRLSVLNAISIPIDYYGNFVDPGASSALSASSHIDFRGTADYITELPEVYNRYALWVDVTNTSFINACGAKVLNCFAAGSMMLIDFNHDYHERLGELADSFMYRNADELNDKITYFLAHPKERSEIVAAMQDFIRRDARMTRFLERSCSEVV